MSRRRRPVNTTVYYNERDWSMCEWLDTAEHAQSVCVCVCVCQSTWHSAPRGGAPIGAGGHDPHFLRQRGTGGKVNVENTKITTENISISVTQSATNQTKELGWLSYLSNILSPPHWPKSGGQKKFFWLATLAKLPPTFKTVAPPMPECLHFVAATDDGWWWQLEL